MENQNVAILSVMAKFDKTSVKKVAQDMNRSMDEIESSLCGINIGEDLVKQVSDALNKIEKQFKNVNLSKYSNNFLRDFINVKDVKDAETAIKNFTNQIDVFETITKKIGNKNIFDNFSTDQLEKILDMFDIIEKKSLELNNVKNQDYQKSKRDELKSNQEGVRSVDELIKQYTKLEDVKVLLHKAGLKDNTDKIKEEIGVNKELTSEQKKQVKEYSQLITLYKFMNDNRPKYDGSEKSLLENIKYNKELLGLVSKINEKENEMGSFSKNSKAYSQKFANENKLALTLPEANRNIDASITKYFSNIEKAITNSINEQWSKLFTSITNTIEENAAIVSTNSAKAIEDTKTAREKSSRKGRRGNFANTGYSGEIDGGGSESEFQPSSSINNLDKEIEETINDVQELNNTLSQTGNNGNNLYIYAQSVENVKEEFEDVIKYAVDAETAFNKLNELWKKYDGGQSINQSEIKDMFGYMSRLDNLDMSEMSNGFSLTEDQLGELNDYVDGYKEYEELTSKITDMTEKQISELEKLKTVKEDISKSDTEKTDLTGANQEDVDTLKNKVEELENSISEMQTKLQTLDGNAFEEMSNNIEKTTKRLNEANEALEKFENMSKGDSEVSNTSVVNSFDSYLNYINKKENELRNQNQRMNEEIAIFDRNGKLLASKKGDVNKSTIPRDKEAETLIHTHPIGDKTNNFRFSEQDIDTFLTGAIEDNLKKNVLYCGNQMLEMDVSGLDKTALKNLKDSLSTDIIAAMYELGNGIFDENGVMKIKNTNLEELGKDFTDKFTSLVNSMFQDTIRSVEGQFKSYTVNGNIKTENEISPFNTISKQRAQEISVFSGGVKSDEELKNVLTDFQELESIYDQIKTKFSNVGDALSDNDIMKFVNEIDKGKISLELFKDNFEEILNEVRSGVSTESIINDLQIQELRKNFEETSNAAKEVKTDISSIGNENLLESQTKQAQELVDEYYRLSAQIQLIEKARIGKDTIKNAFSPERFQQAQQMLASYKQTLQEINNLKLEPETDDNKKKLNDLNALLDEYAYKVENSLYINDSTGSSRMKRFNVTSDDIGISGTRDIYDTIHAQMKEVYDKLKSEFPNIYEELFNNNNFNLDSTNIAEQVYSSITPELQRIQEAGKEAFDSVNVDLIKSTKYVDELKRHMSNIVIGNTGKGEYGDEVEVALRNAPELSSLKNITEPLSDIDFNNFLSGLEKAKPYLDSIGYQVKEIKTDVQETKPDTVITKEDNSSSILAEQQALEKLREVVNLVTVALNEKTKAIQAEEVQMDLSVNSEIGKLEELKGKVDEIRNQFTNGLSKVNDVSISDNTMGDVIDYQKSIGELDIVFRGVENSMNGFMTTSDRLGTFFTNSPYLARQYANSLGGVYEANVALGKSLNINGMGHDWSSIEYLGDGTDETSKKIIELKTQIESLYNELNKLNISGTGLDGTVEINRGDYSYLIQCFGDMGNEYLSYIDAVEKGNVIENQENELAKNLMTQLYELEKAYKSISDAKNNVYGTHSTDKFASLAKENGYDSVIFENIKDSYDQLSRLSDVGVIFDERQVESFKIVNSELDKLISKIDKLDVNGLNLPNPINSDDMNKFPEIDITTWLTQINSSIAEINTLVDKIKLNPEIIDSEWIAKVDEIITKISPKEIKVVPDVSELNNIMKNVNNTTSTSTSTSTVSTSKTVDVQEQNINPYDELFSRSFSTKNKTEATKQLKETYNELKQYLSQEDGLYSESGQRAAYNYYNAYKEALLKNISDNNLLKYTDNSMFPNAGGISIDTKELPEVEFEINNMINKLNIFNQVYNDIINQLGSKKIDNNVIENIRDYVEQLSILQHQQSNPYNENTGLGFDEIDIDKQKAFIQIYKDSLDDSINKVKQYGEELQIVKKEQQEVSETPIDKKSSTTETSQLDIISEKVNKIITDLRELSTTSYNIDLKFNDGLEENTLNVINNLKTDLTGFNTEELNSLSTALEGLKISKSNVENLQKLANVILTLKSNLNNLNEGGSGFLSSINELLSKTKELENLASILKQTKSKISEVKKTVTKEEPKKTAKEPERTDIGKGYIEDINVAQSEAIKLNNVLSKTDTEMSKLKNLGNTEIFNNTFDNAVTDVETLKQQLSSGEISLTEFNSKLKSIKSDLNSSKNVVLMIDPGDIESAKIAMTEYMNKVTQGKGVFKSFSKDGNQLNYELKTQNGYVQQLTLQYDKLSGSVSLVEKQTKKSVSGLSTFMTDLGKKWQDVTRYLLSYVSLYQVWAWIKQGVTYVRELDTALTEMKKVSDETVSSLKNFQKVSYDIADSIGTTAVQVQNSAADFMRLGYSLKEASELSKDANIYANVGDMDIQESTEHMISSIKAWGSEFDSEVEASGAIIDKYNEIGNNFAITSADIGAAMERSAAALKAGGNDINEALGLITAGNLVQQDAETTANALKVMSLRIRGSKTELEDMGEETDNLADSTSKLRAEIKALSGVDIMKDENTYKSTAEIIKELGAVYEKMTDVSQASLLEKLAGKTRASTMAGLLENYKVIDEVIESAKNSNGSALQENEKRLDSIDGKIAQLTNHVQEFWTTLLDSGVVKFALDSLSNILELLTKIVDVGNGIPAILGAVAGIVAIKTKGGGRAEVCCNKKIN